MKCKLATNDHLCVSSSLHELSKAITRPFGGVGSSLTANKFNFLLCRQTFRMQY